MIDTDDTPDDAALDLMARCASTLEPSVPHADVLEVVRAMRDRRSPKLTTERTHAAALALALITEAELTRFRDLHKNPRDVAPQN